MQVSNSGWDAFNVAHKSMDEMQLLTGKVPASLEEAHYILTEGTDEDVAEMLPIPLNEIRQAAEKCCSLAEDVEKKYDDVIQLISEVLGASSATREVNDEKLKETESALLEAKENQKTLEEKKEVAKDAHKTMREVMQEAEATYNKAIKSMPTALEAVAMDREEAHLHPVRDAFDSLLYVCTLGIRKPEKAHEKAVKAAEVKAGTAKRHYESSRKSYEEACKKKMETNKELNELLLKMEQVNLSKVDFEKIRDILIGGMKVLGDLKEEWSKLNMFFQMMAARVRSLLGDNLDKFVKFGEGALTNTGEGAPPKISPIRKKMISKTAVESAKMAYVVNMISGTYVEVSKNYLVTPMAGLGKLLGYDPKKPDDAKQIKSEMAKLRSEMAAAKVGIGKLIEKRKESQLNMITMAQDQKALPTAKDSS